MRVAETTMTAHSKPGDVEPSTRCCAARSWHRGPAGRGWINHADARHRQHERANYYDRRKSGRPRASSLTPDGVPADIWAHSRFPSWGGVEHARLLQWVIRYRYVRRPVSHHVGNGLKADVTGRSCGTVKRLQFLARRQVLPCNRLRSVRFRPRAR